MLATCIAIKLTTVHPRISIVMSFKIVCMYGSYRMGLVSLEVQLYCTRLCSAHPDRGAVCKMAVG